MTSLDELEPWLHGFIQLSVPTAVLQIFCFPAADTPPFHLLIHSVLAKSNCYDDAISQHIMKISYALSSLSSMTAIILSSSKIT